jgi:hypothetical protein
MLYFGSVIYLLHFNLSNHCNDLDTCGPPICINISYFIIGICGKQEVM